MRNNRFRVALAARAAFGFFATGAALLAFTVDARAQTAAQNKAAIAAKLDAWRAGTGSPFELLADQASWTIKGNSVASKRYATKEDFLRDVIRRLSLNVGPHAPSNPKPVVRSGRRGRRLEL